MHPTKPAICAESRHTVLDMTPCLSATNPNQCQIMTQNDPSIHLKANQTMGYDTNCMFTKPKNDRVSTA